jgi:branched-chain amino acid transport system permease protein
LREGIDGYLSPALASAFSTISGQISMALGLMIFALVIILFLVFEPRGLAHRWGLFKAYYRIWPFPY